MLCTLMLLATSSYSQDQVVPLEKMVMKQWTSEDGLVSNNLTSVYQTSDGFIWVTSFNGMHLFDGRSFKLFYKENVPAFRTNGVYSLTEDKNGDVLIATQAGGVLKYSNGLFEKMDEFPVSSVRKLFVDSKGKIWCATNGEGLFYKEDDEVVKVESALFDRVQVLDIFEDRAGLIWIGTEDKGLICYLPDGKFVSQFDMDFLDAKTVTKVVQSPDNQLIIGTSSGVFAKSNNKFTLIPNTEHLYVNDLGIDRLGYFWIASEHGVARMILQTNRVEIFDESKGLPANQVSSVILDQEGSVWLSTKKAGLMQLSSGSIFTLDESDGILNTRINIVTEYKGEKYVGSDDGSISVIGGPRPYSVHNTAFSNGTGIRDITFGDDGTMWIASYDGLHMIKNGVERLLTTEDGLPSNFVRRVLKRKNGTIWLGTRTGGVVKMNGAKVEKVYSIDNGLNANYILALEEDQRGNLVAGTHSGGLSIISKNGPVNFSLPGSSGLLIFNIHIDENNRYWLSTNAGVYSFYEGEFKEVLFSNDLKTDTFFDFIMDNAGNAWITTNLGIIRISVDQLNSFIDGDRDAVDGELFDNSDGMANRECTGATRSIITSDGKLWVPTIDGIATLNPNELRRNMSVPQVAITSFIVDGELMENDDVLVAPGKFRYEIMFASSSYISPEKVQFRYKLTPMDVNWNTTNNPKVEYTNLKPGKYKFLVLASNNDNVWNEIGTEMAFVVRPYVHQTWWFRMILVLAILFAGYFLFVWRVRHVWAVNSELRKLNEELDRFVYSVSHDLRAPLTSILGLTHIAKDSQTKEESDHCVEMIERSAVKLDSFISDIIDYSRNQRMELLEETIDVKEELESIVESVRYLDEKKLVECKVNTSVKSMKVDVRRLRVILKNIISNAIHYHDINKANPYVHIDCWEEGNKVTISVADNGLGIKASSLDKIFKMFYRAHADSKGSGLGLYIAKENANKLNADLKVASKVGVGTSFTLILPKG